MEAQTEQRFTPSAYVEAFQARGVLLWREGEALRYKAPPGVLTPSVLGKLRLAKEKILPLLPSAPSVSGDLRVLVGVSEAPESEHCLNPGRALEQIGTENRGKLEQVGTLPPHGLRQVETENRAGALSQRLLISEYSDHPGPLTEPPDIGKEPTENGAAWFRAWAEREGAALAGLLPELDPAFVAELAELVTTDAERDQAAVSALVRRGRVGDRHPAGSASLSEAPLSLSPASAFLRSREVPV